VQQLTADPMAGPCAALMAVPEPAGDKSLSCDSASELEAMVDQMCEREEAVLDTEVAAVVEDDEEETKEEILEAGFANQYLFWAKLPFLQEALARKGFGPPVETETVEEANEVNDSGATPQSGHSESAVQEYMAQCIKRPGEAVEVAGGEFLASWAFRNVGPTAWPKDVKFRRIRGDDIDFKIHECDVCADGLDLTETLQVSLVFTAPVKPGRYEITFGLVHGFDDSLQFGDEVALSLEAKASVFELMDEGQFSLGGFFEYATADSVDAAQPEEAAGTPGCITESQTEAG